MADKEARKALLKQLARAGKFDEIEAEFGTKKRDEAIACECTRPNRHNRVYRQPASGRAA